MKTRKYSKKAYFITHGGTLAMLLVIAIVANIMMTTYDSALTEFFGTVGGTQTTAQTGDFVSSYSSEEELRQAQLAFTRQVVGEGTVLLKNEDNALPLAAGAKVSVFGLASASGSEGGSGSGDIQIDSSSFAAAMEQGGFTVNRKLTEFTASSKHKHGDGAGPGGGAGGLRNNLRAEARSVRKNHGDL